jgi:GH25 family lysozyme M1 (1,4-beta-N-acetylmuramidase)
MIFRNLMSRKFRRRRVGVLAVAAALAALGVVDVMLVTSGGAPAPRLAVPVAAQATPAAASQVSASPPQAGSPGVPSASATAPAPAVVEKPPPVVDGVKRANVGSAHSPQLTQQLATSPPTMPLPADAGAVGVDVADYQHPGGAAIAWSQVAAAGYKFAFVKGTEGDYYANPYHAYDLAQAKAAGLYVTGYHFAIPNVSDGTSQADYAVANGGYAADGRTLPLALDIEYNPYGPECYGLSAAQVVAWLTAFTAEQQRLTGQRPIIYTTADWWNTCTGGSTAFGSDPLWVAGYTSGSPPLPAGWGNWTFWQYTSRGSVPGITGHVDVSYFLQAAARLGTMTSSQPTAPLTQPSTASSSPFLLPPSDSRSPSVSGSPTDTAPASPTDAASASPADAASVSPTDTASAAPSDSPSPTDPASPSDSPSPTASPSPSAAASACASASVSPSPSPSPSASASPAGAACTCASPSSSASPSDSPSPSPPPSPSPSDAACTSPSPSASASPAAPA